MRSMIFAAGTACVALAVGAQPVLAGETVLYEAAPDWIDVAPLPPGDMKPGSPIRLADSQARFEDGVVSVYTDLAIALDSPEALDAIATITAAWLPDKGDLYVHRVELIRDGEVIDLLAGGAQFEVLRREQGLEQRMVDGALTATLPVSGAKIGDTLRYAVTVTKREQALGELMEHAAFVIAEPQPLVSGRLVFSWPTDEGIYWGKTRVDAVREETRGGYKYLTIDMPIAKPTEIPSNVPLRFRLPPSLRASSFDSYNAISAVFAPHYLVDGTIPEGSALADKVDEIMRASSDPLTRAALATRFVQDEIGYLLNGLDGGNYLPQTPQATWEARSGDCKASSVLLLAMLREMGIESEAVLVSTEQGDAIPVLHPNPGNFNHMIVRADIGGEPYWLDGTNSGTRIANIGEVPRFRWALPVRDGGAPLQEMAMRPQTQPDADVRLTIDQSAGLDVPAIYEVQFTVSGAAARNYQTLALMESGEARDERLERSMSAFLGENRPVRVDVTYDDDSGVATLTGRGLIESPWSWDNGRMELDVPYQALNTFSMDVSRDTAEVMDMPVTVNGPIYYTRRIEWRLPEEGGTYRVLGTANLDTEIGGTELASSHSLDGRVFTLDQRVRSVAWEVPAGDLPQIRRESLRMKRGLPRIQAPREARMAWDYGGAAASRLEPIDQLFGVAIAREGDDPDVVNLYRDRAYFRYRVADFEGSESDYARAVDLDASAGSYSDRAWARLQLGDIAGGLSDLEKAADLDPEYGIGERRFVALALLGRGEEAVALADEFAVFLEEPSDQAEQRAYALGWAGQIEEGAQILDEELEFSPDKGGLLNAACWFDGIWDRVSETTVERCTRAIEGMDNSLGAIDSRALAYYRLGRIEEALSDLDRVLSRDPGMTESRYLRGVIRSHSGDAEGAKEDLEVVRRASPLTVRKYALWGLEPA